MPWFNLHERSLKRIDVGRRHSLEGHGGWVSDVAFDPSNESAITVAGDDLAVVWDIMSGSCKNVLEGHSGEVLSVVMTRQGRSVLSGLTRAGQCCHDSSGYVSVALTSPGRSVLS
jgi:WD40 repeat protein